MADTSVVFHVAVDDLYHSMIRSDLLSSIDLENENLRFAFVTGLPKIAFGVIHWNLDLLITLLLMALILLVNSFCHWHLITTLHLTKKLSG